MSNIENLVSLSERPEEERREIARKGGIASAASRTQLKRFREKLETALDEKSEAGAEKTDEIIDALLKLYFSSNSVVKPHTKVQIFKILRDTCGEKPKVEKD